jgi:hypothetical protein
MKDLFNMEDMDLWYLGTTSYPKKATVNPKTYALYLCLTCNHVWEVSCAKTIIRYKCLPTYRLKRKECRHCQNKRNTGELQ